MKKRILMEVFIIISAALFVVGCHSETKVSEKTGRTWELPVITPEENSPVYYSSSGALVSEQRVDIASKVAGYIRELKVREGDRVQEGQTLVLIDSDEIDSGIRQAVAAVSAADAVYQDAALDMERYRNLFERGSISDNEMRKMRLKFDTAAESLNQAKAGLAAARSLQNYALIKSPVSGIVVTRSRQEGDLALPGTPILTLEAGGELMFETYVAESRLKSINTGDAAEVRIDGIGSPLSGEVKRIVTSADANTRSYMVKIAVPQSEGLMPGMFGYAKFTAGVSASPVIPRSAVIERGGLQGVFVVKEDNTVGFRWLRLGREQADKVEVDAGLDKHERLVAAAVPELKDGDVILPAGN